MAAHVRLKNEFTEDEKYHNLMKWLIYFVQGTMSSDKNELLFQEFEINYNNLPAVHRKGTILLRVKVSIT